MSVSAESVIRQRLLTYYNLLHADLKEKDAFVRPVRNLFTPETSNELRSNDQAIERLHMNLFIRFLCQAVNQKENSDIELLIGGSTAIASIYKNDSVIPNDIDMYIKRCTYPKVERIDRIIRDFYRNFNILLLRNPVNITWIIYDGKNIIQQIQLVIMQVESWAENFITYHSDLTCVGFDIKNSEFVYFHGRWENILKRGLHVHFFTNIVNLDTPASLQRAVEKYRTRGFSCDVINITFHRMHNPDASEDNWGASVSEGRRGQRVRRVFVHNPVIRYILDKYQGISNICLSDRVSDLYSDSQPHLPVLQMANLGPELMNIPSGIEIPCSCSIAAQHKKHELILKRRQEEIERIRQEELERIKLENEKTGKNGNDEDDSAPTKKSYADIAKALAHKPVIEMKSVVASASTKKYVQKDYDYDQPCDCTCPIDLRKHRVFVKSDHCGHMISLQAYISNPIHSCPLCRRPFNPTLIHFPIDQVSALVG
jgi:hypothetical protein